MVTRATPVDLQRDHSMPDGTLIRNQKVIDRGEQCYFASPMDFPAYVRFVRTVDSTQVKSTTVVDHKSTTVELDCYTVGVRVWVKYDRASGRVTLMTQAPGDEKPTRLARWDKVGLEPEP